MQPVRRTSTILACPLLAVTILSLGGCGSSSDNQPPRVAPVKTPGDTPIVIGEGSMKLESNTSFDGWIYIDAGGKPNKDEGTIWIYPDVARVIQSVELTTSGGTSSVSWPSGGRLVVTYGRDQGHGQDVTVTVVALNSANNWLALIQGGLKRRDFDPSGTGGHVLVSKAVENVAQLKTVTLVSQTDQVLCGTNSATACEGGSIRVIFQ